MKKGGIKGNIYFKTGLIILGVIFFTISIISSVLYYKNQGKLQIQFDIHQNKKAIYLSTFAEPPQFAIWLEDTKTGKCKTVFVTSRVSIGDWEGKKNVPVALPRWFDIFKVKKQDESSKATKDLTFAVTGATPKDDYFSVRIDVPPGSQWNCWIEMNLAGDFNDSYPEFNEQTFEEDEFSCGQPALLFKAEINAVEGIVVEPDLVGQSVWIDGETEMQAIGSGITTAREVFDEIKISVIKPKIKLIEDKIKEI